MPQIRKSGKDWIIDMRSHKVSPVCRTKKDAEHLLALMIQWSNRQARFSYKFSNFIRAEGKVTNCALLHEKDGSITELLSIRYNGQTYWVPASECEVIE